MTQHFATPTLRTDSSNNTFSILKMEPSKSSMFHFLLWKEFFFLYTNCSHINIWYVGFIKCYEMFYKGVPIKNCLSQ